MKTRAALHTSLLVCLLFIAPVCSAMPAADPMSYSLFQSCSTMQSGCKVFWAHGIVARRINQLVPGYGDRRCREAGCRRLRLTLATEGPVRDRAAPSDEHVDASMGSGPSDRAGYYLLGSIPLIVGIGGLVGLDHRLPDDNSGIWKRSHQLDLEYGVALLQIGGALWYGGESRIGRTYWQSLDASVFSALTVQVLKYSFSRARPYQSDSPNHWFQGGCCQSFPSGEVTLQAAFVTPFIIEYHDDDPWVWGLEALPLYDALARMKTQGHWQTDVLSGWALGTAFGIFAHNRGMPFFLGYMPHGIMLGWHTNF